MKTNRKLLWVGALLLAVQTAYADPVMLHDNTRARKAGVRQALDAYKEVGIQGLAKRVADCYRRIPNRELLKCVYLDMTGTILDLQVASLMASQMNQNEEDLQNEYFRLAGYRIESAFKDLGYRNNSQIRQKSAQMIRDISNDMNEYIK
ncbi:hypothetical protein [Neisseria shayeganii]|uniref:Uncharacterized protein n=1 Tax=Neisseria shayeganii 871 TaxID=1032488 RepID=G4CFZ5_9NEIS|nr:hypothetical protein [Neisseria shayeganii]EGY53236.1 hypothetical protein HMPREF9371_0534 [Neisseria shayeganii 871]